VDSVVFYDNDLQKMMSTNNYIRVCHVFIYFLCFYSVCSKGFIVGSEEGLGLGDDSASYGDDSSLASAASAGASLANASTVQGSIVSGFGSGSISSSLAVTVENTSVTHHLSPRLAGARHIRDEHERAVNKHEHRCGEACLFFVFFSSFPSLTHTLSLTFLLSLCIYMYMYMYMYMYIASTVCSHYIYALYTTYCI